MQLDTFNINYANTPSPAGRGLPSAQRIFTNNHPHNATLCLLRFASLHQHSRRSRLREFPHKRLSTNQPNQRSQLHVFEIRESSFSFQSGHETPPSLVRGFGFSGPGISGDGVEWRVAVFGVLYAGPGSCCCCCCADGCGNYACING